MTCSAERVLPCGAEAESAALQTLRPHRDPVAVPVHDANTVSSTSEEDEEMTVEDVLAQYISNQRQQTVGALAPIDDLGRDEQAHARRQAQHHARSRM